MTIDILDLIKYIILIGGSILICILILNKIKDLYWSRSKHIKLKKQPTEAEVKQFIGVLDNLKSNLQKRMKEEFDTEEKEEDYSYQDLYV